MILEEVKAKDLYLEFIYKLKHKINFSFVCYNDGEWMCMLSIYPQFNIIKKRHPNLKVVEYAKHLLKIIESKPKYYIGIQPLSIEMWPGKLDYLIDDLPNWCNSDSFHNASIQDKLDIFCDIIKERCKEHKVVFVGPPYLVDLKFNAYYVSIPPKECWDDEENVKRKINEVLERTGIDNTVFLYSASFLGLKLIDDYYNLYGDRITQVDMGTTWEPYLGINTRRYHQGVIDRIKNKSLNK